MNLNKLFPRLTIRAKLGIAFALLTMMPLVLVSVIGTRITVNRLRANAATVLEHDLELAQAQTARSLREVERHVAFLSQTVLAPLFEASNARSRDAVATAVPTFLAPEPLLFQVKLVDATGRLRFVGRASGGRVIPPEEDEGQGTYYAWRAASIAPGERLLLPVEVRDAEHQATPVPAIAILVPVWNPAGELLGVTVAETHAATLFADLEANASRLGGVTGLVDADGLFLYHSSRKRDWASLLASRADINLQRDFPGDGARTILGELGGTFQVHGQMVSFRRLWVGESAMPRLTLYRAVPLARLEAPVRRFLAWVAAAGVVVVAVVLGLAVLAARQFTKPIYQLRAEASRLKRGEAPAPLTVATNDELEDLAADFVTMAAALREHRRQLEQLVAERTRALDATSAELADILAHSADAIIGLDPQGMVRSWNRGAVALFGYTPSEAVGCNVEALIGPRDANGEREAAFIRRELAQRGAVVNLRTARVPKDGAALPVTLTQTSVCDSEGRHVGSSLIVRDNSMQEQLDRHMRRTERLAATSVMAAGIAHELNNPLAIIGNRIECMQRELKEASNNGTLAADLRVLHDHVLRMQRVGADLLRFAREEQREGVAVQLNDCAARAVGLVERTYVTRNLHLELQPTTNLPIVNGDAEAIETVCVNLLLNAADATPPEGRVWVRTRRSAAGAIVELEVRDTGPGVPPELRERVFEPFFTTKGPHDGTGLGLAVCRSIVERHGGHIRVESEAGRGSRFIVTLPSEPE